MAPIQNFIQIGFKTKLKYFAIGRFRLVGLVGQLIAVPIYNLFYVVFGPILVHSKLYQNQMKNTEVKTFTIFESQKCFKKIF